VSTLATEDRWLFDTGAGTSVVSEDLFNRMSPQPILAKVDFAVTGANNKPVKMLGKAVLPVCVLNEKTNIDVLVSPELSYKAILGMDAIRKLNLVLNPQTLKFSTMRSVPISAVSLQTYRVPAMCGRPIKIKLDGPMTSGSAVVSTPTTPVIDKLFVPEAMTSLRDNVAVIMVKNCNTHDILIPAKTVVCDLDLLADDDVTINATTTLQQPPDTPMPMPLAANARKAFINRIRINVPDNYRPQYVRLFLANHDIFSTN